MHKKHLQKLVQKFLDGRASAKEITFLENYYAHFEQEPDILDSVSPQHKQLIAGGIEAKILQHIHMQQPAALSQRSRPRYRWAAAAAVLLAVSLSGYLFVSNYRHKTKLQLSASAIVPGHNGAVLTLSDGSKIILDSTEGNEIHTQGGVKIITHNGEVTYISQSGSSAGQARQTTAYNTLETPLGRRFKIVLPDGTQAWLNSASSLRYPTVFSGKERDVELSGEAYFEVVHNAQMPFTVHTRKTNVRVLGTGFNIMAYDDETTERTTLVHGLVQVSSAQNNIQPVLITPGQQAALPSGTAAFNVRKADTSEVLAWLNGKFVFNNGNIKYVMRQIARWYDVSVQYQGNVDDIGFEGILSRRDNIADILDAIQTTNEVHFKIEGKTITVISGAGKN